MVGSISGDTSLRKRILPCPEAPSCQWVLKKEWDLISSSPKHATVLQVLFMLSQSLRVHVCNTPTVLSK